MKTKPPLAYDLYAGGSKLKLPCQSPVSSLTLLRFTEPCQRHPEGTVVAKGYPPFAPSIVGLSLIPRDPA